MCIADLDTSTALLEPDCVFERIDGGELRTTIPQCKRDESGWLLDEQTQDYLLPPGEPHCWAWLTDGSSQTQSHYDDMSAACIDAELPGEIHLSRRPGSYPPYDAYYQLRCRPCA